MARTVNICVAFVVATALVQASQQARGEECPSDDEPKNAMLLLQTNLHSPADGGTASGLEVVGVGGSTGAHIAAGSQPAEGSIKLIVNSDVRYHAALDTLFESMEKASFHRWGDVIVMRGSASKDSDPFIPNTAYGKRGVTYIDLKLSSFDLHGFSGLYHHHHDPQVEADVYFYIHDTVLVNSTFPELFDSMVSTGKFEARHTPAPFNNICVFGSGVVDAYGTHFDKPISKSGGLRVEINGGAVSGFAQKETLLESAQELSYTTDLWHTGYPRVVKYFQSFGITKYILHDNYGDLTGHVKEYIQDDPFLIR